MKTSLVLSLALFAACSSPPNPMPEPTPESAAPESPDSQLAGLFPPDTNRLAPNSAPTPFSADEIRAACPAGAFRKFRIKMADKAVVQLMTFRAGDSEGTTVEGSILDEDGKVLSSSVSPRTSWKDLQGHASFPSASTSIARETTSVLAGDFDCWHYVTEDPTGLRTEFDFAVDVPGPPVRMVMKRNGQFVQSMELLDWGPR